MDDFNSKVRFDESSEQNSQGLAEILVAADSKAKFPKEVRSDIVVDLPEFEFDRLYEFRVCHANAQQV